MLTSLILDNNKKVCNRRSLEKVKLFDINLEPTMSHLDNGRVTLKLNNSTIVLYCIVTLF